MFVFDCYQVLLVIDPVVFDCIALNFGLKVTFSVRIWQQL
jgi:hypothetical protein